MMVVCRSKGKIKRGELLVGTTSSFVKGTEKTKSQTRRKAYQ